MGGIYCIQNTVTGRRYIGQTTRKFKFRFNEHRTLLNRNKHQNPRKEWHEAHQHG